MSTHDHKKRNIGLIIGLSIPVAMVLFIAIAINGPRWFNAVEPASFNFLYTIGQHNSLTVYSVVDGRLTLREQILVEGSSPVPENPTRFFVHDVSTNISTEIPEVEAMALTLDASLRSPDGFSVETGRRGGWFIFGYGRNYRNRYLVKDGFSEKLMLQNDASSYSYYWNFRLLGWVVSGG